MLDILMVGMAVVAVSFFVGFFAINGAYWGLKYLRWSMGDNF